MTTAKAIRLTMAILVAVTFHRTLETTLAKEPIYLSPSALAASPEGRTIYIACATAASVEFFDTATRRVTRTTSVPGSPLGLALSADGQALYVACAGPESTVCVVDTANGKVVGRIAVGHTAMAPVLSPDEKTLFVCSRFDNRVEAIDLEKGEVVRRFEVPREPVAAAITPDGKYLLVANHIHAGRSDVDVVAASVSVLDLAAGRIIKEINLPNGSSLLRDVRISPDGRHAVVTHLVARYHLPTTQVERGWINTNAISLIDLEKLDFINTVLLDNIDSGAANPWGAAWSEDGRKICVTHPGTHELSVVDFPALLAKLAALPDAIKPGAQADYSVASRTISDVPNDLAFLVGLRQRVRLTTADRGPRALVTIGNEAWLGNYFSDTLSVIDLRESKPFPQTVALGPCQEMTVVRRGELAFNDATICFQGWQSCASCHSSDARVDGLNWDNLNDGIGNPKNSKSLLQAHETPPMMWLGVRSDAAVAVRAGIRHSMFTVQPEETAIALDEYLKSLTPVASPHLVNGKLSPAAERGKKLFFNETIACADCHDGQYYTDGKLHRVGTVGRFDKPLERFDTPALIETWRTAPYLHDGSARTLQEVLTIFNANDEHGKTSPLSTQEIEDLAAFVLSL